MGRFGGAMSGAASGAQLGSMFMPGIGTGIGAAVGGIAGALGGGLSEAEKRAQQAYLQQLAREKSFWGQAEGAMSTAKNYFQPIAGGSRTAAMEAMAPELQQGMERIDMAKQSSGNLSPRSGGAAAMANPYAKADFANQSLFKMRGAAAGQMMDIGKTYGRWASGQGSATGGLLDLQRQRDLQSQAQGASFYEIMKQLGPQLGGMFGGKSNAGKPPGLPAPDLVGQINRASIPRYKVPERPVPPIVCVIFV